MDATDGSEDVVKVTGLVDAGWARRIGEVLARARGPVRIDLSEAILVSRSPLAEVLRKVVSSGRDLSQVSILSPRVTATMLLRRWGIADWITVNPADPDAGQEPGDQKPPMTA
jgi:hypothetical protein